MMLSTHKNESLLKALLHAATWVVLLLFPYFLSQSETVTLNYVRYVKYTLVPIVFYAIIFYTNSFVLTEHFLFKKKLLPFLLSNVVMVLLFTWLHFEIKELLNALNDVKPASTGTTTSNLPPARFFIYKDIISMIIPIIICYAIKTREKWNRAETEKQEREKDILDSELQHLRYQLQPHFFFNSLNTVYALIERSPSLAQETVHSLARLMRYMLYETDRGQVSLNDEISFMKQYIELMKLRLSDKTKVDMSFPALAENYQVAPLLFISLIENAFKHGISATQPSEIFFSLSVSDDTIRFFAENTSFPKNEKDKSGSGIGLQNLRKRLDLAYPGKYKFQARSEGGIYSVLLEISLVKELELVS